MPLLPEQITPPQPSMGCVLSHPEDYLERPPVLTPAPEHQVPREELLPPAQYQTITLQDLQQSGPQTHLPDPQTPPTMLPILSTRIRPPRTSPEDIQRGRSRNNRHTCETCLTLDRFPAPPIRCPKTGEPIVTEQELERRWRQRVVAREMAARRRPLGHEARFGGVPMRNGLGGRVGGYGGLGASGVENGSDEGWEDGEGAPDIIEGGFSRRESRLRQSSEERRKAQSWIERCTRARCVGFLGEVNGGVDGETEIKNEGLTVYHDAVAQ
ncbi:hypothetical protein BDZ45DRAFT_806863 [Acephala macrosclerotiorum]|nr:hypothetical protein BDZ45DRAFT_806863 [Acephala macrosclerotiorum]